MESEKQVTSKFNWSILLSGVYIIVIVFWQQLEFISVVYTYIVQSLIISIFIFLGIILANDKASDMSVYGEKDLMVDNKTARWTVGLLFLLRCIIAYGVILILIGFSPTHLGEGLLLSLVFIITYTFNFVKTYNKNNENIIERLKKSIEKRLLPLVVLIIFGSIFGVLQYWVVRLLQLEHNPLFVEKVGLWFFILIGVFIDIYYERKRVSEESASV